jgi:PKD repeat protein
MMNKIMIFVAAIGLTGTISAQTTPTLKTTQTTNNVGTGLPSQTSKMIKVQSTGGLLHNTGPSVVKSNASNTSLNQPEDTLLNLSPNGKLLSVDGFEVDFLVPSDPQISSVCYTPRPYVSGTGSSKSAGCPFTVPCDNPANRDAANTATTKYFQLVWHVMLDGGASTNIDQTRIDQLMAELNADFSTHNAIFCANPASFYEDVANYYHDSGTEEWQLKDLYNVTPTQVINIYVVGDMTAGGYARFPYDPNGGTDSHGGIVLNRGNCNVGTHTLAHEMGHVFGLEHTFSGVDERGECSACYEQVRNANGSSNASGAPTPFLGPYNSEGDQEGDWCSDTNPHDTYAYNCSTSSNTNGVCDSDPWANAPVNNHMSYSFCSSQFTNQQGRRMHCMVDTYLGSWTAYGGGICGTLPPGADFVGTPTNWQSPNTVTFTDLSQPTAIITTWTWNFNSAGQAGTVTPATFVGQVPPTVVYDIGASAVCLPYEVTLTVTSSNGNDSEVKTSYINVCPPAGDCDTLLTQWETPAPTYTWYNFGAGYLTGVQDPSNSTLPTDPKGVYEMYPTPTPGVTEVGAVRIGLANLNDLDGDMVFQVVVYDDDGFGAPGAVIGGSGGLDPTALGVPGYGFYQEFWFPLLTPAVPTTGTFHVGIEMFPGDANDSMLVIQSLQGQGELDNSGTIFTTGFGFENLQTVYGLDNDQDIVPMLGGWAPQPIVTSFAENVVCDTTFVTIFDTTLYSNPTGMSFTFADGTSFSYASDPLLHNRVYTSPGPDTLTITAVNACGRADTTVWLIPYNFLSTPDAEFSATQNNPVCLGAPGVDFTADVAGYQDYSWDFGDGSGIVPGGNVNTINHVYTTPGTYYVELTVTEAGFLPLDTLYLEDFESGWPAGYARFNNDAFTPDPGVNPPFTGTNATAWLDLDANGDGDTEAVSTSWNAAAGQLADDWMLTTGIGVLPANQRLFWNAEASDVNFPDGYEVRISTTQLPATVGNYSTVLLSVGAENAFSTTRSVDLSSYAGQTVYIAFRNNSDFMNLLYIDDIRVGTASPGCSASILKTDYIEVIDCSVIPPVAVLNASPSSGCVPLTVTFTDATVAGDPATSWLWNFGDGSFSTLQNPPAHLYTAAGTYFVTFDACNSGGCTSDVITITVGVPPTIVNVATTDPTCAVNSGTITITATGGAGAYTYSIDNGVTFQAGNNFTGLGTGTYDIVVEDVLGCQVTTQVTLNLPPFPSIASVATVDPLCNGGSNGTITITGSGGTGTYTYSIDNGVTFQAGNSFVGLNATTYNIVIQDGNGCEANTTATLNDPAIIVISNVANADPSCNGGADGTITITASGGTGTYTYSIDNGVTFQAGNVFAGLGAATYNVVVEDANGCQVNTTATLANPAAINISNVAGVSPTCNGGTDGSLTITASGGTGALTYSIDNGVTFQAGNVFAGLGAATYNVVVEDANGCQANTTATINNPPAVVITNVAVTDPSCNGSSDGSLTITASGGTGALTYSIDNGVTFQAGNNFAGIGAATYNIVVEDASGCQATTTATLTDPAAVTITNVAVVDPSCNGGADGTLTITASGGTGVLSYSIDNGVTFQASNVFTGLGAATYNIVVEDANGCQGNTTGTVSNPVAVSYGIVITDENCGLADGQIVLTGAGGDGGPYSYSIDNGITFQVGGTFTGLVAGPYSIIVEDASGCQGAGVETVISSGAATILGINEDISLICNGDCNGQLTASVTGGVLPYVYSWVDGALAPVGGNSVTITGLCADTYTLTVVDNGGAGCTAVLSVVLGEPTIVTYSTALTNENCGSGNGQIVISGAAGGDGGPYNYSIDNGITFQASGTFTGLSAAAYNVVVEDGNGCQATSIVTLTNIAGPNITNVATVDPTCGASNGIITITASGGTGALTYSIDNGVTFQAGNNFTGLAAVTYTIVVEDANGCQATTTATLVDPGPPSITNVAVTEPLCGLNNGDLTITASGGTGALNYSIDNGVTFQAGNVFTGLGAATYNIVVEDANGCQATTTATLTNAGSPSITNVIGTDPACGNPDGQIDITASGGTGVLTYSIDNGVTFQTGNVFTGLTAATYSIVVEDVNGCQANTTATLTNTPAPVITLVTSTDPTCGLLNGDITITASGGTGVLIYSINNGATFQASNVFTGLDDNTYNIVVEDASGCQATSTVTLTDAGAPTITITNSTDPFCGAVNGDIVITASGGTGALTYSIDNGVTFQAGNNFSGLGAGTYDVVVEDALGCQVAVQVILVDQAGPTISAVNVTNATCGLVNGAIAIIASGGTGTLQYSIDNGVTFQASNNYTGLGGATYNIVVEDANGCQATTTAVVLATPAVTFVVDQIGEVLCQGDSSGSVDITVTGGTLPYQFDWSDDGTGDLDDNEDLINVPAGTYTLTVYDSVGCTAFTSVTITEPTSLMTLTAVATDESFGSDGTIDLTVTGGTGPYLFDWDNDGTGDFNDPEDLSGLVGNTTYNVTVMDANGCTQILSVFVGSVVGISEFNNALGLTIYPNPTNGKLTIDFAGIIKNVEVVDMLGRSVLAPVATGNKSVDATGLSTGKYMIRITTDTDQILVEEFVVQK